MTTDSVNLSFGSAGLCDSMCMQIRMDRYIYIHMRTYVWNKVLILCMDKHTHIIAPLLTIVDASAGCYPTKVY